jgi:hypothetical protein
MTVTPAATKKTRLSDSEPSASSQQIANEIIGRWYKNLTPDLYRNVALAIDHARTAEAIPERTDLKLCHDSLINLEKNWQQIKLLGWSAHFAASNVIYYIDSNTELAQWYYNLLSEFIEHVDVRMPRGRELINIHRDLWCELTQEQRNKLTGA